MAVAFGATDVLTVFIRHGCDVLTVDSCGRNVIHCLIYSSFMRKDCSYEMSNMYKIIQQNVPVDSIKDLLKQEDNDGLRPLEYALHTSLTWWIDITDYERNGDRRFRSPLLLFAMYDRGGSRI